MDITLILLILYIIGYIFTSYYQNEKIKAIEKENESLSQLISSVKDYIGLIDFKKIRDYADLREEKGMLDFSKVVKKKIDEEIIPELKKSKANYEKSNQVYQEIIKTYGGVLAWMLSQLSKNGREKIIGAFKESSQVDYKYLRHLVDDVVNEDKKENSTAKSTADPRASNPS